MSSPRAQKYFASLQFSSSATASKSVKFSWLTAPNKSYVIETRAAANNSAWTPVNTNLGNGYINQFVVTNNSGSARFYRLRLQP